MEQIYLRFRSIEDSPMMISLYSHLRQMSHQYREVLAGKMVGVGMQLLLNEEPSSEIDVTIPTFIPNLADKKVKPNARYNISVESGIYNRFCERLINPENHNQFAFYVRTACLLGYNYLHGSSIKIAVQKTEQKTSVNDFKSEIIESMEEEKSETINKDRVSPASDNVISQLKSLGS